MTNSNGEVSRGTFIVLEGTDGTGKSTQYEILKKKLKKDGQEVVEMHFPRYDNPSSYFVREYLRGQYGTAEEVGPYTASLFYALDRYQSAIDIENALIAGKIVLCDRFTGSNMAHQGTKFAHAEERRGFFIWLDNLEFEMLKIPRPDISLVLTAPYEVIAERLNSKVNSSSHTSGKDIHEANPDHIQKSLEIYKDMCNLFPKDFKEVSGIRGDEIQNIENISKYIYETLQPLLPIRVAKNPLTTSAVEIDKPKIAETKNPYIDKYDDKLEITSAGQTFLDLSVTNSTNNVYAFTDKLSPTTIAAAMARLSRRGDDMRITLLDEFAAAMGKDAKLLQRVISAYGDDSVQQLVGQHVVVENASNLLTKKLEWGRLAAYLEQSTRYIYFDKKDSDGKYRYVTPKHFDEKTKQLFESTIDQIFDLYSDMVHKLTRYIREKSDVTKSEQDIAWQGATRAQACDAIRSVLPVATKSTVGIYASGQALESLIMHLMADDLPEAVTVGKQLLTETRKVIPTFLERADKPDRGGATIAYNANTRHEIKRLAYKYLPDSHSSQLEPVQLVSSWPRNELDLVPDMLYEHSSLSIKEIRTQVNKWSIEKKEKLFIAYMGERLNRRHRPGRAIEKAHYSWDLVCDYGIFRDLQRHRMVDDMNWQQLTPRYGYDIPEIVDESQLTESFEKCFDLSLELYSKLQEAGYDLEAQYATLLGHKMRWKITYNAREAFHLHELRTSPQGHPGYRKLVLEMHEKLAEVHPMMAEAMKFVNQDEDPALTRLAAERATQFKLEQLE